MRLYEYLHLYKEFSLNLLHWIGRENLYLGYMSAFLLGYAFGLSFSWAYLVFVWFLGIYLAVGSKLLFER